MTHSYRHKRSNFNVMTGEQLHYVTRTGALWAEPIGKATFTVKSPWPHYYVSFPAEFKLKERAEEVAKKPLKDRNGEKLGTTWTHVFEMTDWTPKGDLLLTFGEYLHPDDVPCQEVSSMSWEYDRLMKELKAEVPNKKKRRAKVEETLQRKYFAKLSDKELRVCRNLPYALHGYLFKDKSLRKTFYPEAYQTACSGCRKDTPTEEVEMLSTESVPSTFTRFFFQSNPKYDAKLLSSADTRYVRLAKAEQVRRKAAK